MPLDVVRFVQAMMAKGYTLREATDGADLAARHGGVGTVVAMLGTRHCQITTDIEGDSLILKSVTPIDTGRP